MVDTFSLPLINIPTAIGLVSIVTYLTHQDIKNDSEGKGFSEILGEGIVKGLSKPAMALLFGWIVTIFM